jgi:hypothetical protein
MTEGLTKSPHLAGPLAFIVSNFAGLSAIGLVAVVVCSTIFLYSYLSIFDWQLIWIIDYSDIFKVGLVALGALSGFIIIVQGALHFFVGLTKLKGSQRIAEILGVCSVAVLVLAVAMLGEWKSTGSIFLYWLMAPPALLLLAFCFVVVRVMTHSLVLTAERIIVLSMLLVGAVSFSGLGVGLVTKLSLARALHYDVFLKDREVSDLRLVLFTSHHAVFDTGEFLIVLPTSEIIKMVAHPPTHLQQ